MELKKTYVFPEVRVYGSVREMTTLTNKDNVSPRDGIYISVPGFVGEAGNTSYVSS